MKRLQRTPSRLRAHLLVMLVGWPLLTVVATAVEMRLLPHYSITWPRAVAASLFGVGLIGLDILLVTAVFVTGSVALFRRVARPGRETTWGVLLCEPISLLAAVFCGACLWFPTLLSSVVLAPVAYMPAWLLFGLLVAVTAAMVPVLAQPGRRAHLGAALLLVGTIAPALHLPWQALPRGGRPADLVVLGVDSISQHEDVSPLRGWVAARDGAWYEHPVTPGLITNAVWTSVLMRQPIREHGVFHVFQQMPAERAPFLTAAHDAGYHTVGMFSDQFTAAVGAQAGFDEDQSGPIGWRQLILPLVENGSVLLPLMKPMLPSWWPSLSPPNHVGMFTYDLGREIREILTAGHASRQTLVMGHLTYIHQRTYPRLVDMSWAERWAVARARASELRDRTFYWRDEDRRTDAIPLHRWKPARLQQLLTTMVDRTGLLARGGRLIVFSDHGGRADLTFETFSDERYHRVVLATLGLAPQHPDEPRSLVDIATLAGVAPVPPAAPVVEFALSPPEVWPQLIASARLRWSGEVRLDPQPLREALRELRRHVPQVRDSHLARAAHGGNVQTASVR